MSFGVPQIIASLNMAYKMTLKHIAGCSDEQWNWKPYPECKSIGETVEHLIVDNRATVYCLRTGGEPDYEKLGGTETDRARLMELLDDSHQQTIKYIEENYADKPLDTMVTMWGMEQPLGVALGGMVSEYSYHAGQVAFIRMATDPSWDYYASVYGA